MKNKITLLLILAFSPFLLIAQTPSISPQSSAGCAPYTVQFEQVNISNPADWAWYFEGGTPANSTDISPTVTFEVAGYHLIYLINSSNDTLKANALVESAPTSNFTYATDGKEVTFSNISLWTTSFHWAFGDGATSQEQNPIHLYDNLGAYSVYLTTTNQCGSNIFVQNILLSNDFSADITEGCAALTVHYTQENPASGTWTWTFPGGTPSTSTDPNPTVTYENPGVYNVILTNNTGETIIKTDYIHAIGVPSANFTYEVNGAYVTFDNNNPNGDYSWNFGDGSTSTQASPVHHYSAPGSYDVTLTVTTPCGSNTYVQTITTTVLQANFISQIDTTISAFVKSVVTGNKQGIFNVTSQHTPLTVGKFHDFGSTGLGLDQGIILSTGDIFNAVGPNDTGSKGTDNQLDGDILLSSLIPNNTFDAAIIEFDFVPSTNVINFSYVFASEEYPEFVNAGFNDIFGFFISGPGVQGQQNIALVPNTGQVVSIDNVNDNVNNSYYQANIAPGGVDLENIQFDGFTVPLVAEMALTPFDTFHIKIAIADVGDHIFDSAVFLKANSFQSKPLVFNFDFTEDNYEQTLYEDSTLLEISATLPAPAQADITYHFSYSGDAEMGVDYIAPEIFTFQAGDTTATFKIKALADNFVEGDETLLLAIKETQDTLTITIKDQTALGNQYLTKNMVQLSPNPSSDIFAIPNDIQAQSVEIFSLSGKLVKTFSHHFEKMNISDFPKGIYSVRIKTMDGILVSKLKVE